MTHLDAEALDAFRVLLLEQRASLLTQEQLLARDDATLAAARVSPDERIRSEGDADTLSVERGLVAGLSDKVLAALADIEAALARVSAGTYGVCRSCGGAIPVDRLECRPRSLDCVRCAARR